VQFVVVGLVIALALLWVTGILGERIAREQAIEDARTTTSLLAETVVEPALSAGLLGTNAGDLDKFDRLIRSRVLENDVVRVKVWDDTGTIIYSDEPRLIGQRFELESDEEEVLQNGGSAAGLSDLTSPENKYDQQLGRVLEVYTRVQTPDGKPLLFEVYLSDDNLQQRTDALFTQFRPLTVGGVVLFLILSTPLLWVVSRRADRAAADRERFLVMATEASDAERRRIARDLHDGVVQDLAGTSFALSGLAREVEERSSEQSEQIEQLATSVRASLMSLRSLLVEIYPPELAGIGLAAALQDLVAPANKVSVAVKLDVTDVDDLPDDVTALIWRTAQECVRNALRHGQPTRLRIDVHVEEAGQVAVMIVTDNGRGFDTSDPPQGDHFGLRGLRDLARESGASLAVRSTPGLGTEATLRVPVT